MGIGHVVNYTILVKVCVRNNYICISTHVAPQTGSKNSAVVAPQ